MTRRLLALLLMLAAARGALAQRPQLGDDDAARYRRSEVLAAAGPVDALVHDNWDPLAGRALVAAPPQAPHYRVDPAHADARLVFASIQAAIDHAAREVLAGRQRAARVVIGIAPGQYQGLVHVPALPVPLTLRGEGTDPRAVVIHARAYSRMSGAEFARLYAPLPADPRYTECAARQAIGTDCTPVVWVRNTGFRMQGLTVENRYDESAGGNLHQAVALATEADRVALDQVRLLGNQDTLYLRTPAPDQVARVFVYRSLVQGDVDFIFGAATAYFQASEIRWVGGARGAASGFITAASTTLRAPYGFVFEDCDFTSDGLGLAAAAQVHLGRQWFAGARCSPYGDNAARCVVDASPIDTTLVRLERSVLESVGKVAVLRSRLGAHIRADAPWAPWQRDHAHMAYRAAQFTREDFRQQLRAAGHDPDALGYPPRTPPEPFLAEYRNLGAASATPQESLARSVLADGDGWASAEGGTRGGADAAADAVFDVHDRAALVAALAADLPARIVRIHGAIDLSADRSGRSLGDADLRDPAYDFDTFVATYAPERWGRRAPAGPQEEARRRSAAREAAQVVLRVPGHTTIVGVGADARLLRGTLLLDHVEQVIVRNLAFEDAYDHFPAWDPFDNGHGEWNSEYDNITLRDARHVWIDHCRFSDGDRPDDQARIALGQRIQHHDGLVDITRRSDLVTVSWNVFRDHDKTTLVGGSDGHADDAGRLRVTFHHNLWQNLKERAPRVRFGQVHVYNNLYVATDGGTYRHGYSIGVGFESRIVSEHNAWEAAPGVGADTLLWVRKGTRFVDHGSVFNGRSAELRAPGLSEDVGWQPELHGRVDPADEVTRRVREGAGTGRI